MTSKIKGEKPPRPPPDASADQGADLWAFATKDVTPLPREKPVSQALPAQSHPPKQARKRIVFQPLEQDRPWRESAGLGPPSTDSVQTRQPADERLRRKNVAIEAWLDLHGHTRDRAHGALIQFIQRAHERGARCLLVITGKGRGGMEGVLRRHVPEWLGMPPLGDIVLSLHPARPRDGGTGALYVFLRKKQ